jgi:hypothetical protein
MKNILMLKINASAYSEKMKKDKTNVHSK